MMKGFIKRLHYGEMRFRRTFRHGEKGFTLMELLIVVAVLGVLAAVLVPRLTTFFATGEVAAANTEVANVESAAMAFYADTGGTWPTDTNTTADESLVDGPGTTVYTNKAAQVDYTYDVDGKVVPPPGATWGSALLVWDAPNHIWEKP